MNKADILIRSNAIFDSVRELPFKGSIAINGNRISKVIEGSDDADYIGSETKVLDYGDKMVMAGFVDAHDHFFVGSAIASDHMCKIFDSTSEADAVEKLKEYRKTHPDEKRLRAFGWFPAAWDDAPLPNCRSLDEAFPDVPAYCISADFHTFWCNSLAMEEAGYTPESKFPAGSIGLFEDGTMNGLIFEPGAFRKAQMKTFDFSEEEMIENLNSFIEEISSVGVTSVAEMSASDYVGGEITPIDAAKKMSEEKTLNCRIHIYSAFHKYDEYKETKAYADNISDDRLQLCGVKGFLDGVTSTYTAYLLEPYTDRPDTCGDGCPLETYEVMSKKVIAANAVGLPVRIHCIGDAAVREALDCYEASIKANGRHGLKNTIEHIEVINPSDIPRFKDLDVIASIQPQHLPLDEFEKSTRCGEERAKWQWAIRSIMDAGAKVAFGTDYPVVGFDPYPSIHSAVTRCNMDNEPASTNPEQKITLYESLVAYTLGSADVYDRAHELGSIEEGKLADIIAVDRNLFAIPEGEIKDAKTIMTMMDGKIIYEA